MTFVEGNSVPGHEAAHDFAEWGRAGTYEKVTMVRDQGPGIALGLRLLRGNLITLRPLNSAYFQPTIFDFNPSLPTFPAKSLPKDFFSLPFIPVK